MNRCRSLVISLFALTAIATKGVSAEPLAPATAPAGTQPSSQLTVAVLDFDATAAGSPEMGKQIGETLTALLSGEQGFTLVDRAALTKTISEHELNLTGVVDANAVIQIGKLVGAKILITGRSFALDKSLIITAKIIGTETSLVDSVMVKGKIGSDTGDMVSELAGKIATRVRENGAHLIAGPVEADGYAELKEKLRTKKRPTVALAISEQHVSQVHVIDPPVDTELRKMLTDCGFTVIDSSEITPGKAGVEVLIKSEGISEFAARIGNIMSCTGRVEISVVKYNDGKTLFSDRATARAADFSENIAAKLALQKAAHEMGLSILKSFAETLPPASKPVEP